ncbi:MAG: protein kinase [Chloroflexi bacterium]|nr:protein kinase [Chloroflexota bacterium]
MNHPNIVGVYDFDVYQEDTYYLVMEYIAGGTLKQRLEDLAVQQQSISLEKAVRLSAEVADALHYAHERGMVHRDIKPANIMLGYDDHALLTDFGIVKMMGGQTMAYTVTGALIGTPSYMSPEQAMGKAGDKRVDIYALGVLLFQMTTGQLPFTADTPLAVIMKHVNEPTPNPVTFNANVPAALQDVILKAMAKEPEDRYQTAGDMATDLRAIQLGDSAKTGVYVTAIAAAPPPAGTIASPPAETDREAAQVMTAVSATQFGQGVHDSTPTFQSIPLPTQPAAAPPPAAAEKKRPLWLYVGLALLVLILIGGTAVAFGAFRGGDKEPEAGSIVIAAATETSPPPIPHQPKTPRTRQPPSPPLSS